MTKMLSVTIERGVLIDTSSLSQSQVSQIENELRSNDLEIDDIATKYGISVEETHYDADVTHSDSSLDEYLQNPNG